MPRKPRRSPEQWAEVAEELAKKNGGKLPLFKDLQAMGYWGMIVAMQRCPGLFKHIELSGGRKPKKRVPNKTKEEWIALAEKVAEQNGGVIPCGEKLTEMGYDTLRHKLSGDYAEWFYHIPYESRQRSKQEWVAMAEELAAANGGYIPSCKKLVEMGHRRLYDQIKKHPHAFAHLPRQYANRKPKEDWVILAESLAKENDGVIPSRRQLRRLGHGSLSERLAKHPEWFSHLPRAKPGRRRKIL